MYFLPDRYFHIFRSVAKDSQVFCKHSSGLHHVLRFVSESLLQDRTGSRTTRRFLMEILIVRHGETDYNKTRRLQGQQQIPLNDTGKAQARQLADSLRGGGITHIYCSGLRRARETADIINESFSLPVITDNRLNERNFGVWERRYLDELLTGQASPEEGGYRTLWDVTPENAETFEHMVERTTGFLNDVMKRHRDSDVILVVSHGGPIRILLGFISERGLGESTDRIIANGRILRFTYEDSKFTSK